MMVLRSGATALIVCLLAAGTALAQQRETRTIDPGMTFEQVRAEFGEPLYTPSRGEYTYYFYANDDERQHGFLDLVIFQNGQVVDAVLRAPWHRYTGESSSPRGVQPRANPGGEQLQTPEGSVEGVEVRPAPDTTGTPPS